VRLMHHYLISLGSPQPPQREQFRLSIVMTNTPRGGDGGDGGDGCLPTTPFTPLHLSKSETAPRDG
jgi:hypothetical protein